MSVTIAIRSRLCWTGGGRLAPDCGVLARGLGIRCGVKERLSNQGWLSFLKLVDCTVPDDLEIHLIADNYGTHKHANVTTWLEHPTRHNRWHSHYTPTSSSWLNLIERWFKELTDKRLPRDSFTSVDQLIDAIELWTEHWRNHPKPFI